MTVDIPVGFDEDAAKLPGILDAAFAAASEIASNAQELAPVVSGDYKAGIGAQKTSAGARVYASDFKSAWIEFGVPSDNEPAQFVLRRAAELSGYPFVKKNA